MPLFSIKPLILWAVLLSGQAPAAPSRQAETAVPRPGEDISSPAGAETSEGGSHRVLTSGLAETSKGGGRGAETAAGGGAGHSPHDPASAGYVKKAAASGPEEPGALPSAKADFLYLKGEAALSQGNPEKALHYFKKAAALHNSAFIRKKLISVYMEEGLASQALFQYRKILQSGAAKSDLKTAHFELARFYSFKGLSSPL